MLLTYVQPNTTGQSNIEFLFLNARLSSKFHYKLDLLALTPLLYQAFYCPNLTYIIVSLDALGQC